MEKNLNNRIVSEVDPIYLYKDWRQKKSRIAVYIRVVKHVISNKKA